MKNEKQRFDEEASNKTYEENQAEIQAELSKPFDYESETAKVDYFRGQQMVKLIEMRDKIADMFGLALEDGSLSAAYKEIREGKENIDAKPQSQLTEGDLEFMNKHEWSQALYRVVEAEQRIGRSRDAGKSVLSERQENERQKKIHKLIEEIEAICPEN